MAVISESLLQCWTTESEEVLVWQSVWEWRVQFWDWSTPQHVIIPQSPTIQTDFSQQPAATIFFSWNSEITRQPSLLCYSCVKDVNSDLDESASSWSSEYLQTEQHCTWCGKRNLQKRISSHCWYDWQWCWSWSHGWCWEYEMCNMWCEYWSSLIITDHHTHPLISTSNIYTQLLLFKHLILKFWMKS